MDIYNKPPPQVYLMRYCKPSPQDYLTHHGILGQKWGKKNGPPYPLGASDHSASEKRAGWRKSLDNGGKKADNKKKTKDIGPKKGLSPGQKKAIVIGATAVAAVLVTYGAYKLNQSGKLDPLVEKGKQLTGDILDKFGDKPISSFDPAPAQKAVETVKGFKKLAQPESLADTLKKANPLRIDEDGKNNCVLSAIAGFMRQAGYDVTAGGTPGGKPLNPGGIVEECFKGAKVIEGSAAKFGRSQNDAAEMLLKRFGPNAQGLCGVQWKGGVGGHTFSWKIVDGVVSFFDAQTGSSDVTRYWAGIDLTGNLTLARLDDAEINFDVISKYINRG